MSPRLLALSLSAASGVAWSAPAAPELDLQRWSPPLDSRGTLWTRDASDAPRGWASFGSAIGWQREPYVYRYDGGREDEVVGDALQVSMFGGWSAGPVLVGAELPLLFGVQGAEIDTPAALGDVSLELKGVLLDHEAPLGVALLGRLRLPSTAGVATDWSLGGPSYELSVVADLDLGPALLALNLGTHGQPAADFGDFVVDDAMSARLGAAWRFGEQVSVGTDLVAELPWASPFADPRTAPVELMLNGTARLADRWRASLGVGRGLTAAVGSPELRVVAQLVHAPDRRWEAPRPVVALAPPAPPAVEAPAPPPSPAAALSAPSTGTLELFVLDAKQARVPDATWTISGLALPAMEQGYGVVELPVGQLELVASAPGYVSARFPVWIEGGASQPMTVTLRPAKVEITRDRLVIAEKVFFDTNRATIKPASFPLLDEIANVMQERPDILSVRVEGHTDARGSAESNLTLSELRAASVRDYLVARGVSPGRLRSVGYGEAVPLDDRDDSAARDRNRRVEFFIEQWSP